MNDEELLRYSRQIMLPEIDIAGQEKLLNSSVLIIGLGGLGSPVAMYLAAAGVGHLILVDFDEVDLSNLQRQVVHSTQTIGRPKVESAGESLRQLNPAIRITAINEKLTEAALEQQLQSVDVVVDCSDNFSTRFALNQLAVKTKTPLVSGAAIRMEGQITVFDARRAGSPCYRCLYDDIDDENLSCAQNGVLAPLVGIIGTMQATEVIKIITGFGEPLVGRLQLLDVKSMTWRELKLNRDPACPVCGASH